MKSKIVKDCVIIVTAKRSHFLIIYLLKSFILDILNVQSPGAGACNPILNEILINTLEAFIDFDVNFKDKRAMMALGRSPEYHWNQIISKSVHRFSRRSLLKLFSIKSPGGHFVQQSGTVRAIL